MKKQAVCIVLLLLLALLLCGCGDGDKAYDNYAGDQSQDAANPGGQQQSPLGSQTGGASGTQADDYDPASEEDNAYVAGSAAHQGVYAGATPLVINPIDMPTATPRPELAFTYGEYTATKLGLKFNSIVGYEINDAASDIFILTEPEAQIKDNYGCVITLQVSSVTSNYKATDIRADLAQYLKTLSEAQYFSSWETYKADDRTLMGGKGYYNNYRGVLADGRPDETVVRGRVHMALIGDNKLLTLHITCPGWYNPSYMNAYDTIRKTLKVIE